MSDAEAGADFRPLISIIITNYNYASFLKVCINSALSQTYPKVEVIVVDDGSKDGSREIIESFSGITTLFLPNNGQAVAFRAGLELAHGDIIHCLDADDYLYPNACEVVAANWVEGVSAVAGRLDVVRGVEATPDGTTVPESYRKDSATIDYLLKHGYLDATPTSGMAFRADLARRVSAGAQHMDGNCIDAYLTFCAPLFGKLVQVDEIIGGYRIHGENVSLVAKKTIKGLQAHIYNQYWAQMTFRAFAREIKGMDIQGPPRGGFLLQWIITTGDFPNERFPVPLPGTPELAKASARCFLFSEEFNILHRLRNAIFIMIYVHLPRRLRMAISRLAYD